MGMDRVWYVCKVCLADEQRCEDDVFQCEVFMHRSIQTHLEPEDRCIVDPELQAQWMFGGYD